MPRSYGVTNLAPYAAAPAVGNAGDTYYNTASKVLYLADGTAWNALPSQAYAEVQSTPPTATSPPAVAPPMGLLWVDTSIANPTTVNLPYFPPQTPPGSGFNSFIDGSGEVWVSLNGSAWKKARDGLRARAYRNAAWSGVTGGTAPVAFDTISYGAGFGFNLSTGIYTCPIAGDYLVMSCVNVNAATTNYLMNCYITKNGVNVTTGGLSFEPNNTWGIAAAVSEIVPCAAGDTMAIVPNLATTVTGQTGSASTYMTVKYMGTG